jgi:hypothetical protein
MANFRKIVERLKWMILSFRSHVNIIVCRPDFDSLIAAFALEYYVSCVLGNNSRVRIFYNGDMDKTFLRIMFGHFKLPNAGGIKHISEFDKKGNNIFIDVNDDCGIKVLKNRLSVVIGNVGKEVKHSHCNKTLIFPEHFMSASAVVFNIIRESGYFRFEEKGYGCMLFLLAIAIDSDTNKIDKHAMRNMSVLAIIMGHIKFKEFHRIYDNLPREVLEIIEKSSLK